MCDFCDKTFDLELLNGEFEPGRSFYARQSVERIRLRGWKSTHKGYAGCFLFKIKGVYGINSGEEIAPNISYCPYCGRKLGD